MGAESQIEKDIDKALLECGTAEAPPLPGLQSADSPATPEPQQPTRKERLQNMAADPVGSQALKNAVFVNPFL